MSVLGKKPYITSVLASLTTEQLSTLTTLINNPGTPTIISLYGDDHIISAADKGVKYATMKLDENLRLILTGFLLYTDTYCCFVAPSDDQSFLKEFRIDVANKNYHPVYENLTADELRSEMTQIKHWLSEHDYIINKHLLGEYQDNDPRWTAYLSERTEKLARYNELEKLC